MIFVLELGLLKLFAKPTDDFLVGIWCYFNDLKVLSDMSMIESEVFKSSSLFFELFLLIGSFFKLVFNLTF